MEVLEGADILAISAPFLMLKRRALSLGDAKGLGRIASPEGLIAGGYAACSNWLL